MTRRKKRDQVSNAPDKRAANPSLSQFRPETQPNLKASQLTDAPGPSLDSTTVSYGKPHQPRENKNLGSNKKNGGANKSESDNMMTAKTTFWSLPRELRDIVFEHTIDLGKFATNVENLTTSYCTRLAKIDINKEKRKLRGLVDDLKNIHGRLQCPSVLLVSKQFHAEAVEVIYKSELFFTTPSMNDLTIFRLSDMVRPELLAKPRSLHFQMAIKQRTPEFMELQVKSGKDWFSQDGAPDETLEDGSWWAYFMLDCFAMIRRPGIERATKYIRISIVGQQVTRTYSIEVTDTSLDYLTENLRSCEKSRDVDEFIDAIEFLETPVPI